MIGMNTDLLTDATITALERTAMVLAEPAESIDDHGSPFAIARIAYSGPTRGTLILAASDAFLRDLAASLLGEEPETIDPATQGADALKEMANILGGSIIVAMSGEECEYSLSLPDIIDTADLPSHETPHDVTCTLTADDGVLQVIWTHEPSVKAA